jgi:hypothetical protein
MSRRGAFTLALALGVLGCGGTKSSDKPQPSASTTPAAGTADSAIAASVRAAAHPVASELPAADARPLLELAGAAAGQATLGLSTSVITPRTNRLGFALIGADKHFLYGPSAVYVAPSRDAPAQGPYLAPIDSMVTASRFKSMTVADDPLAIRAVYEATVRVTTPGVWAALVLTRASSGTVASLGQFSVDAKDAVPTVGQRPPRIHTPTEASVQGDLGAIDTRIPHDDMHRVDFANAIGRRPVVLLFATPQLCQSRVCGPVTDIELQMEHEFAGRATFIHNEVYADNDPNKGLRPQLTAFHLQTEPWLFTFDRRGRIAARVEGAFGLTAFRRAVRAALR